MSYWSYCLFRCACLRQPFVEAFEALKESGVMLLLVLGAALPAAAFTVLYGFGLLFDAGTDISSLMLTSWLILLLQTLWLSVLRKGILASSYSDWLGSLPTPSWLVYTSHFVLCSLVNIMLWPSLVILFNIDLIHWPELGHIFVFLLLQVLLGVSILNTPKSGVFFVVLSYLATQMSQVAPGLNQGLEQTVLSSSSFNMINSIWAPSWALTWMITLTATLGLSIALALFTDRAYCFINKVYSKQRAEVFTVSRSSSRFYITHLSLIISWVKHESASLILRVALVLLLINLANLVQIETVSDDKNLSQYIGGVLLLLLMMVSASWQFTISHWLQSNALFLKSLPAAKFVLTNFVLLPGMLFLGSLILVLQSSYDWLQVSGSELVALGLLLVLLQFFTHKWPKLFIVWFSILSTFYGFLTVFLA